MVIKDLSSLPELFTASDVARFCQVDLKTIHNWVDKGEIKHFRTPGRHLRFRRLDVVDFLRKYGYPVPELLRQSKPKIVVIEDDASALATIRRALSRKFDLVVFQDPFEALLSVGAAQPEVLVLDIAIGGIDGIMLLERLRRLESTSHVRVIVYSDLEHSRKAALEAGAHDFIRKGDLGALRESLEKMLGVGQA